MRKKIYFRADAGVDIGYGHFIRTLALADMLKDNFDCVYYTVSPTLYQKEELGKVCNFVSLEQESHFESFLLFLKGDEIVILDNYFFTTDYQRQIKAKGCKLVCIDDMHDKHYFADIVINHGLSNSAKFSIEGYTQLCLGYSWALLRSPFRKNRALSSKASKAKLDVVICFGGSDFNDLTGRFLDALVSEESINHLIAIVGDKYDTEFKISSSKVSYLHNLSANKMADIFRNSDLAFLSASTVCMEALSCGTLVAAGYYVDNQEELYSELSSKQMIYSLGNLCSFRFTNSTLTDILREGRSRVDLSQCFSDISRKYNLLFLNLFDKRDFQIGGLLFKDYCNMDEYQIREIWSARNEDEVRCWMENSDSISWEDHLKFLSFLSHTSRKIYFGVYSLGELIGSVNIEMDDSFRKIDRGIFIIPRFLNLSLGSRIEQALVQIISGWGIEMITARILKNNIRSLNFHLKNGYILENSDGRFEYLVKRLFDE